MPQLDGSSSDFEELQFPQASGISRKSNAVLISFDSDEALQHSTEAVKSVSREDSFTPSLRTMSTSPKSFNINSSLPASILSTTAQSSNSKRTEDIWAKNKLTTSKARKDKNRPKIVDLRTPPRVKERRFGRELNTNTQVSPVKLRKSPRRHRKDEPILKESSLPAVQSMKPLKAVSKADPSTMETKKRKITSLIEQTVNLKNPRSSIPKKPAITQSSAQGDVNGDPQVLKPTPASRPPSPVKLILNFAKRPAKIDIPDGVATLTYEDFQNMTPTVTAKICWCNKPAAYSTHKKNDHPHISQCTNLNCRFRWYHYACLNRSDKGKARFGNLVCQVCRNEQDFAERENANGWSTEKLLNYVVPWSKEDLEAEMPGLGGHAPVTNPYGLCVEVDLGPAYWTEIEAEAHGALGALDKIGYTQSRPHMLEEAYLHSDAYFGLRADRSREELANEGWWYDKVAVEKEHSHGDDMDDDDTAEEL